jgi:hypothetical protein
MTEQLTNFQMNFQVDEGKFYISESPTGQETIFMLPKKPQEGLFNSGLVFEPAKKEGVIAK